MLTSIQDSLEPGCAVALNPKQWNETAILITKNAILFNGGVLDANPELNSLNLDDYDIVYLGTESIVAKCQDAYPEDDPGYCYWYWYEAE